MIIQNRLIWAIIIFICAGIFRLSFLDLIEFKLDEARDVYEMERFFTGPYFIQRGTIQSTGVYNPPLWYYFLALISLPSRDPIYLSFMIALINSLAVAGFYWVVKKFYGSSPVIPSEARNLPSSEDSSLIVQNDKKEWFGIAEISGLLLAFSPWAILFSRKIWAPDLLMVLLVPLFYFINVIARSVATKQSNSEIATLPSVARNDKGVKWAYVWVVLLLSLLAQLHASGLFLAVAMIFALIIVHLEGVSLDFARDKRAHLRGVFSVKFALFGLLISLIPLLPYIAYQIQTGCQDCQNFFEFREEVRTFDINVFLRPFQLINGSSFQIVLGDDYENFLEQFPYIKFFNLVFLAEFILGILGIVYIIVDKTWTVVHKMCLLGFVFLIPLLYLITQTPAHLHYFVVLSPIMMVIYSLGILHLGGARSGHLRGGTKSLLGGGLLAIIIIINVIFTLTFYQFLDKRQTIQGDFGPIYRITKQVVEEQTAQFKGREDYHLIKAESYVNLFNN